MSRSQEELFTRYLEVCNQALKHNGERFPFKQILGAAQTNKHKEVEVCIIDDQPAASYVIHLSDYALSGEPKMSDFWDQEKRCVRPRWRVTRSYLEDVIQNPEEYIRNPAKIDWEWLYTHPAQNEND